MTRVPNSTPGGGALTMRQERGDVRELPADIAALRVALIGYGEVGRIFGGALVKAGVAGVTAFDILVDDGAWAREASARSTHDGVQLAASMATAIRDADVVISAVTAAATASAAEQIAHACLRGAFVLDVNSASPHTKSGGAAAVERAGGRYVEAAVMSSVPPHGIRVPMLLGGPHAEALQPTLARLGFDAIVRAPTYGVVSAIKLCRSVFVKGMEALTIEGLLAARRYRVEDEVLKSLAETYPGLDWERQATWYWQRVVQHGRRRAEEMREAAATVTDAGLAPRMAQATANVQAWVAALRADGAFVDMPQEAGWRELADRVARDAGD